MLFHVIFSGIDCLICNITQRAADTDTVIVTQVAADLPNDHWNRISGKLYLQGCIEIVDCLDQTDAADLKQVIGIFITVLKTAYHA